VVEFEELEERASHLKRHVDKYFEENKPYADLGRTTLLSGATYVAARGVNIIVQVASTILLARLLSPYDFGLVAMVTALAAFAPVLIDFGTSDASIQKTHITEVEVSTLFWLNTAIGAILTVFFAGGSGLIALVLGEPALTGIAILFSLTFIMTAVATQHYALMRRAMQFRHLAVIDVTSNVIGSVVGIVMAFRGWGYWALVAKPIVTGALTVIVAWMSCPWVPGRPRLTPEAKELIGFGVGVTGFTLADFLATSDRLALAYFYGAGAVGYFQNAFLIYSNVLVVLAESLHNVATSGLSKLRNSVDELKRSWAAALSLMSFISAAVFAVLTVTGQDFVVVLLGQKWAPAGPLLSIFAAKGIAHSIQRTTGWLHVAAGRSDRWMRWGFFSAVCQLLALAAGLPFGMIGVAIAYMIVTFALFVPALAYAGHPVGIGAKDVVSTVGPQIAGGLITAAFGFMMQHAFLVDFSAPMRLFISATICTATYLTVVVGVFRVTGPLHLAVSILRHLGPTRSQGRA
jgi:polysaccharide transporter, PST family